MQPTGANGTGAAFFRTENGGYGTAWKSGQAKTVEEVPLYKELVSWRKHSSVAARITLPMDALTQHDLGRARTGSEELAEDLQARVIEVDAGGR